MREKWINQALSHHSGMAILRTIPGLGKILSELVALEGDDIQRFYHPSKLCAYAGLVPSTYASGGKVRHGAFTAYLQPMVTLGLC